MARVSVIVTFVLALALAVGWLVFADRPLSAESLQGQWKAADGGVFAYTFRGDGTFEVRGAGAKGILSTVTRKLTGRSDELTGRYSLSYNPLKGNTLTLTFDNGEVRRHNVTETSTGIALDGVPLVRELQGPSGT